MKSKRLTVKKLAAESGLPLDEALIALWDAGFDQLSGPNDLIPRGESNRARRAVGLATRRELATPEYWQNELGLSREELHLLLQEIGVGRTYAGNRLTSKAIHRLRTEYQRQLLPKVPSVAEATTATSRSTEAFQWEVVGHRCDLKYITVEEVLGIHEELAADFATTADPIEPAGVRSIALLQSAVSRPHTSLAGELKYPTAEMSAAALLHGLVHDHPFHNGNKRTALVSMLVSLDENGILLTCQEDSLFKLVLQLAQHALVKERSSVLPDREVLAVATWIRRHSRLIEKGDRALPWRKLKRILARFDCAFSFPSVGNRINIERRVVRRSFFLGRRKEVVLKTQTHYGDDGREVDKAALNRIRHELQLDDEHGIDSAAFYDNAETTPSDFILQYRKTLRRLAKL